MVIVPLRDSRLHDEIGYTNDNRVAEYLRDFPVDYTRDLGHGTLGIYHTKTDYIGVATENRLPHEMVWTEAHERDHLWRAYTGQYQDEAAVDRTATNTLGYHPMPGRLNPQFHEQRRISYVGLVEHNN